MTSPSSNSGSIKISIKNNGNGSFVKALGKVIDQVTITRAQIVIEQIEFESTEGDSFDFELEVPFIQDLMLDTNAHVIQSIQIPFGSYKESEIEIDDLDSLYGNIYTQNPDLQDRSVFVQGYLNDNPNDTFTFSSDLEEEQEMEFNDPLVLNQNSPSTNIVLLIDTATWFFDNSGNFLDPRISANKSQIEENIKNSIDVFEDEDDDGKDDDY